ncbi:MAG: hypothetical protein U5Q16_04845 [Gammaproteobacteria bacterium]|nr:hypothetical protein [Gammaproteobacteria bacterium]
MRRVIRITEQEEVPACDPATDVSGVARSAALERSDAAGVVSLAGPGLQDLAGPVRGGIVNQDDLPPAGVILFIEGIQLLFDGWTAVERGNHDRDQLGTVAMDNRSRPINGRLERVHTTSC